MQTSSNGSRRHENFGYKIIPSFVGLFFVNTTLVGKLLPNSAGSPQGALPWGGYRLISSGVTVAPMDKEIPMARAQGSSAHLLMKRETAYGQAATGTTSACPSTAAISAASRASSTARCSAAATINAIAKGETLVRAPWNSSVSRRSDATCYGRSFASLVASAIPRPPACCYARDSKSRTGTCRERRTGARRSTGSTGTAIRLAGTSAGGIHGAAPAGAGRARAGAASR